MHDVPCRRERKALDLDDAHAVLLLLAVQRVARHHADPEPAGDRLFHRLVAAELEPDVRSEPLLAEVAVHRHPRARALLPEDEPAVGQLLECDALALSWALSLPVADAALLMVLSASASYIVVPAVLRSAIPEANPAIDFGLSLGITFPLNILIGIPLSTWVAQTVLG